ncbi:MAG: DUF4351 domain-containing protein [Magnetococcales bacterium]|nr:DUF4351 domain-containing protein [Magnetococcales bacterium]
MPYITSVERIGEAKGREAGLQEGHQTGLQKGKAETLLQLLQLRFGTLPKEIMNKVNSAGLEELSAWTARILDAKTLQAVFQ